jgi:16S rRNA (uracil1498-N3)-methyltransferase
MAVATHNSQLTTYNHCIFSLVRNRFHLAAAFTPGERVALTGAEFHHAVRVARVGAGEVIELFDGDGRAAAARVESISQARAELLITDEAVPSREPSFRIELAISLIQLERFELVLQKATELGAWRITPLLAERSEVREERIRGKRARWEKIIFEAVKQSGRSRIPDLAEPQSFEEVIRSDSASIIFDSDAAPDELPVSREVTVLIGPEGGWSAGELGLARERGACFRRLGPRRLRAETAAIAALTTIGIHFGDLAESAPE